MPKGAWADLAVVGAEFALRVTPRARREEITRDEGGIRVAVLAPPEDGKANAAGMPRNPLLLAVDHEGGRVQRFRPEFTLVPAMGQIWPGAGADLTTAQSYATEMAWLMATAVVLDLKKAD